eukprot:bmy_10942T0
MMTPKAVSYGILWSYSRRDNYIPDLYKQVQTITNQVLKNEDVIAVLFKSGERNSDTVNTLVQSGREEEELSYLHTGSARITPAKCECSTYERQMSKLSLTSPLKITLDTEKPSLGFTCRNEHFRTKDNTNKPNKLKKLYLVISTMYFITEGNIFLAWAITSSFNGQRQINSEFSSWIVQDHRENSLKELSEASSSYKTQALEISGCPHITDIWKKEIRKTIQDVFYWVTCSGITGDWSRRHVNQNIVEEHIGVHRNHLELKRTEASLNSSRLINDKVIIHRRLGRQEYQSIRLPLPRATVRGEAPHPPERGKLTPAVPDPPPEASGNLWPVPETKGDSFTTAPEVGFDAESNSGFRSASGSRRHGRCGCFFPSFLSHSAWWLSGCIAGGGNCCFYEVKNKFSVHYERKKTVGAKPQLKVESEKEENTIIVTLGEEKRRKGELSERNGDKA